MRRKKSTDLPVFVTAIFDERGKLLTGADVPSVVAMLEGLRVDALGINCGLGPAADDADSGTVKRIYLPSDYRKTKCGTSETARRKDLV